MSTAQAAPTARPTTDRAAPHQPASAVEHWKAERAYWTGRLEAHYRDAFGVGLDPLQSDDNATPGGRTTLIQDAAKANPDAFYATGARTILLYLQELTDHAFNPSSFRRVFEFGLGFGRLIRHWLPIVPELAGSDVTPQAVDFCTQTFGDRIPIVLNSHEPSLPYPDAHFDHVFANSVFTHIRARNAPAWAAELARVTRPGGAAIFTALDENLHLFHMTEREFDRSLRANQGVHEWGRDVVTETFRYATDEGERALWSPWFDLLEVRRHFKEQRHVILRRKA